MNTHRLRQLILQAVTAGKVSKDEIQQLIESYGAKRVYGLLPDQRIKLATWLIGSLGGCLYALAKPRGSYIFAAGFCAADAYQYANGLNEPVVAYSLVPAPYQISSDEWQARLTAAVANGKVFGDRAGATQALTALLERKKKQAAKQDDDEEFVEPAKDGHVGGFGLVAVDTGTEVDATRQLHESVITKIIEDNMITEHKLETHSYLQDGHIVNRPLLLLPLLSDETTKFWLVRRCTPAQPAPAKSPLQFVAPLPGPWGR